MPLENVRELLQFAEYLPGSLHLDLDAQGLWDCLSGQAKSFVWIFSKKEKPGPLSFSELWGHVWADDEITMESFGALSDDDKAAILAFSTVQIHELTHHFDFLTTPYGVNFQGKLFREYCAFQRFAPFLLKEAVPPPGRLVDFDPLTDLPTRPSEEFLSSWKKVHDIDATLEALGDGGMAPRMQHVVPGWGDSNKPIILLNHPVDRVTVRGFLYTVTVPDERGWYLRPSTILETRALLHCLKWILKLFGKDERAREPICLYLDGFYGRDTIAPDYRFLVDLLASSWGVDQFHTFVRKAHMEVLHQFLMIMDAASCYALQAPPPMPDASAIRSSPIVRLFHALRFLYAAYGNRQAYSTAVDALNAMDTAREASAFELEKVDKVLTYCTGFAGHLRQLNRQEIVDPVFQKHFDHVLGAQQRQVGRRIAKGYVSYYGMPEDGHPVLGLRSQEEVDDLAPDAYFPETAVQEWFAFRQNLLYHYMDTESVTGSLQRFFPGTPQSTKQQVQ